MKKMEALPKAYANLFFLLGLISALSFRAIIIVQHTNASYVRVLWYLAVITNLIFFLFRYYISRKRKRAVGNSALRQKLEAGNPLDENERDDLLYLLTSIERSRENLNYMSIFILSALAITIDIFLSLK